MPTVLRVDGFRVVIFLPPMRADLAEDRGRRAPPEHGATGDGWVVLPAFGGR
jgi:hypothetical protein